MMQAAGVGAPCLVAQLLEANDSRGGSKEQEQTIKNVAATGYGGQSTIRLLLS